MKGRHCKRSLLSLAATLVRSYDSEVVLRGQREKQRRALGTRQKRADVWKRRAADTLVRDGGGAPGRLGENGVKING